MQIYTLTPNDVLFFRDGRPMEAAGGHGARWPEPSLIFDALHAALHRAFPETQEWEHIHRLGCSSDRNYNRSTTERFGGLKTAGFSRCSRAAIGYFRRRSISWLRATVSWEF